MSKFKCAGSEFQREPDLSHCISKPYTSELISTFIIVLFSENKTEVKFNVCIHIHMDYVILY